jgi:hypothetical protein
VVTGFVDRNGSEHVIPATNAQIQHVIATRECGQI